MLSRHPALVICALLLGACTATTPASTSPAASNATSVPGLPTTVDALPDADITTFDRLLAELHGTPVVVNFWASWCAPCAREAPVLTSAHARYGDRVQFLGIDMLDSRDGAERFIAEHGITYPSLFDPDNIIGLREDLFAPPMTLVFDARGDRVATIPGELAASALEDALSTITG